MCPFICLFINLFDHRSIGLHSCLHFFCAQNKTTEVKKKTKTDRQTGRQADRQTGRQTDRQADRKKEERKRKKDEEEGGE